MKSYVTRDNYFFEMRRTGEAVYAYIVKLIEDGYSDSKVKDSIMYFVSKRYSPAGSLLQKPFLVRLCYEISGGKDWSSIIPIASACELINISSYQSNCALDGKYGILSKAEKDNQTVASFLTRELAQKAIYETKINYLPEIQVLLSEINANIYLGQFQELNILNAKNLNFHTSLSNYLKLYLHRCYKISGTFTMNCCAIGYLLSEISDPYIYQTLRYVGLIYGIALAIINDMSDYIPQDETCMPCYKTPIDQLSDIRNRRVLLPVFYAIVNGVSDERKFMLDLLHGLKNTDKDNSQKLLNILINQRALGFSYSTARLLMKLAKKSLKNLPPSTARNLLSIMLGGICTNKFIFILRRYGLKAEMLDTDAIKSVENYIKEIKNGKKF